MEDAGGGHAADVVGGPAEDGAVVHLGAGPVAERAARLAAVHQPAVQLSPLGRVVERPRETHLRRVGRDVTQDGGRLPLADAEDELKTRLADRRNCGAAEGKEGDRELLGSCRFLTTLVAGNSAAAVIYFHATDTGR